MVLGLHTVLIQMAAEKIMNEIRPKSILQSYCKTEWCII